MRAGEGHHFILAGLHESDGSQNSSLRGIMLSATSVQASPPCKQIKQLSAWQPVCMASPSVEACAAEAFDSNLQGFCPCGDRCSNQQFSKRQYARLEKVSRTSLAVDAFAGLFAVLRLVLFSCHEMSMVNC